MYLYIFLSIIVICITIIICFVLSNFTEISDYREYKNDHVELKRLKDEYNENITKYQTQIENICDTIKNIKVCNIEFIRNDGKMINILFSIKSILYDNIDIYKKLEAINNIINKFQL